MKIGVASDHGGYELKVFLADWMRSAGHTLEDFGSYKLQGDDDYPDYVIPMATAIAAGDLDRGIAVCGSGVGACIAANKVAGVRAALIVDSFSAHQGVEDDDMNLLCLGGRIVGRELAKELVSRFLEATFKGEERFRRRLAKIAAIEKER